MQTPRSVKKETEEVRQSRDSPRPERVAGPGKGRDSVGEPTLEQFVEDCSAWKELEWEKLMEG